MPTRKNLSKDVLFYTQSIVELAESKGIEVRTASTETIFPLRGYVDKAGGSVKKLPSSYGSFEVSSSLVFISCLRLRVSS